MWRASLTIVLTAFLFSCSTPTRVIPKAITSIEAHHRFFARGPSPECSYSNNLKPPTWPSLPLTISFVESFPDSAKPAVARAVAIWNEANISDLFVIGEEEGSKNPKVSLIWVTDVESAKIFSADVTALTIFSTGIVKARPRKSRHSRSSEQMKTAEISFNAYAYKFARDGYPDVSERDLEDTAIHELGHVLGLSHSESGNMIWGTPSGTWTHELTADTKQSLKCLYRNHRLVLPD
jgi:hypothetical protein